TRRTSAPRWSARPRPPCSTPSRLAGRAPEAGGSPVADVLQREADLHRRLPRPDDPVAGPDVQAAPVGDDGHGLAAREAGHEGGEVGYRHLGLPLQAGARDPDDRAGGAGEGGGHGCCAWLVHGTSMTLGRGEGPAAWAVA